MSLLKKITSFSSRAIIAFFLVAFTVMVKVNSFSVSVPPIKSVCTTMVPGHDKYKPQEAESPFLVSTDVSEVPAGGVVEVTLQGTGNRTFQGYYLQARNEKNMPVGMFNSNTLAKVHSCNGVRYNAAHHANSQEKNRITVSWLAPKRGSGEVTFTATFVENYVTFWTKVTAPVVRILS